MLLPWDLTTAFCAVLLTDTLNLGVLAAAPRTLKKPTAKNFTEPIVPQFGLRDLFERQQSTCYSPNLWCPLYSYCCSPTSSGCCPDGCAPSGASACCGDGYCDTGELCCENTGCIPSTGAECCLDGGYCPDPFRCVQLYSTGDLGCCTDLTCSVYLDSDTGATITYTATAETPATTRFSTDIDVTTDLITYSTDIYYTETYYQWYTTTLYWTYWFYFYTIIYSPSTYTTRATTTTTRTTTLSVQALDADFASLSFDYSSIYLPTPDIAESYIPAEPTPGAVILIPCAADATSTALGSGTPEGLCTATATTSETTSGSSDDTSSGGDSGGDDISGDSASGAVRSARVDLVLVTGLVAVGLCATLMVAL